MDERGCFYANFKPLEGDFVRDGHVITSAVGTFKPNDFGLYDTAVSNVSEWTSTAYTESIDKLTSDLNPEYRYDAAKEDPYKMKRKIVRGGSWKDAARNLRSDLRQWEFRNEQRSYIGFRNVRSRSDSRREHRNVKRNRSRGQDQKIRQRHRTLPTRRKGQRFFNFAYSIGAAIVIRGALFKILHLPGGSTLLCIGVGTEIATFHTHGLRPSSERIRVGRGVPRP